MSLDNAKPEPSRKQLTFHLFSMKDMSAEKSDYELSGTEVVPSVTRYGVNCPNSII